MFDPKVLEELSAKLDALIAASPIRDAEKNARALMGSLLSRMDLVTREEFEIQARVLAATREKLEALEARITELERQTASVS